MRKLIAAFAAAAAFTLASYGADAAGYPVVVKPADQDGGIAVSADIRTGEELEKAFHRAREKSANVLVEQFIPGRDYRLQVFRGRCVWAIERVPASVTGDGVSTIERLVAIANADPRRGDGPHSPLKRLKLDDEALELLQRDGLSVQSIPAQGAFVKLRRASNVGSGGMPVNVMDAQFRSFSHLVLPYLVQNGIAPLAMKTFGDGVILKSDAPIKPIEYLHFSLNLPVSVVITGIQNQRDLDQAFEAVKTFKPMDRAAVAELLSRSKPYALEGKYELFKTSATFDGTAKNAAWLGEDVASVKKLAPTME